MAQPNPPIAPPAKHGTCCECKAAPAVVALNNKWCCLGCFDGLLQRHLANIRAVVQMSGPRIVKIRVDQP